MTAAQRQARDAGCRDDAGGHGQPKGMRGVVDVALGAARANPRRTGHRIDAHALHGRQVDDEAVVDAGKPGSVMTATANRNAEVIVAPEIHRRHHVGDIDTARDQQRPLVDHAVVELPRVLVGGIATLDKHPAQALAEFRPGFFRLGFVTHDVLLARARTLRPHWQTVPSGVVERPGGEVGD